MLALLGIVLVDALLRSFSGQLAPELLSAALGALIGLALIEVVPAVS